jgi:hypothetical protein
MVTILTKQGWTPGNPSIFSGLIPLREISEAAHFRAPLERPLRPTYIYSPSPSAAGVYHGPVVVCAGWMFKGLMAGLRSN